LLQEAAAGVGWSRLIVGGRTDVLPRHLERQDIILLTIGENLVPLLPHVGSFLGRNILAEESRACSRFAGSKQFEQNAISSSKEVGF